MSKVKYARVQNTDGSMSSAIPIGADARNVQLSDGTDVQEAIDVMDNEIDSLNGRMDTFTHLAEGSTTGDAELIDIRIGADGTVYNNAGTAVREQVKMITRAKFILNDNDILEIKNYKVLEESSD